MCNTRNKQKIPYRSFSVNFDGKALVDELIILNNLRPLFLSPFFVYNKFMSMMNFIFWWKLFSDITNLKIFKFEIRAFSTLFISVWDLLFISWVNLWFNISINISKVITNPQDMLLSRTTPKYCECSPTTSTSTTLRLFVHILRL